MWLSAQENFPEVCRPKSLNACMVKMFVKCVSTVNHHTDTTPHYLYITTFLPRRLTANYLLNATCVHKDKFTLYSYDNKGVMDWEELSEFHVRALHATIRISASQR